jgi:enoyl-CoA hydratase/carnithine racemase
MTKQIASIPPAAIQRSKEILRHGMQSALDQVIPYELMAFHDAMKTDEHRSALSKPTSCIRKTARGRWVCWKNFIAAPLNV